MKYLIILTLISLSIGTSYASDLEDLAKQGYSVVEITEVQGDFEGCDYDRIVAFSNGYGMECTEYNYNYAYRPDVFILIHPQYQDIRFIIDNEEFEGRLLRFR